MVALTEQEFQQLSGYVKEHFGINLSDKKHLVMGRLQGALAQNGFDSFSDFYRFLIRDAGGDMVIELINRITTNHTFFLREFEHFQFFRSRVLPELTANWHEHDLRIWSAGCSSGQEPYTLAMILADYFKEWKERWDTRVLATDISERVLEIASTGVYNNDELGDMPAHWRIQYFKPLNQVQSIVLEKIRNEVVFRRFNLMNQVFPFKKKFHVIFCRNVMIYFDQPTKQALIDRFYDYLEPGGYLFVGLSESIGRQDTRWECLSPAVYRKD